MTSLVLRLTQSRPFPPVSQEVNRVHVQIVTYFTANNTLDILMCRMIWCLSIITQNKMTPVNASKPENIY